MSLIVLVITIIVMIILATVIIISISNNNIVEKANEAVKKNNSKEIEKSANMALSELLLEKQSDNSIIISDQTIKEKMLEDGADKGEVEKYNINYSDGKVNVSYEEQLLLLKRYILGDNLEGKELSTIIDLENYVFINDSSTIADASTNVEFKAISFEKSPDDDEISIYIKYNNKLYEVRILVPEDEHITTKSCNLVYSPTGREGQQVSYSYDGTSGNTKNWTILYDHGSTVEIISSDLIGEKQTIGCQEVTMDTGENFEEAKNSYNSAIATLNTACANLITNSNKISVRSAGSAYNSPNQEGVLYTSATLASLYSTYNEILKGSDTNYKQDLARMIYWGVSELSGAGEDGYWMASRDVYERSNNHINFTMGRIYNNNEGGIGWSYEANTIISLQKLDDTIILSTRPEKLHMRPIVLIESEE